MDFYFSPSCLFIFYLIPFSASFQLSAPFFQVILKCLLKNSTANKYQKKALISVDEPLKPLKSNEIRFAC